MHFLAIHEELAGNAGAVAAAEDGHGQLRAARALEAGEAHDLAPADVEADVVHHLLLLIDGMIDGPVPDLHAHVVQNIVNAAGIAVRQLTAHHAPDDPVFVDVTAVIVNGLDGGAVPDHGNAVSHIGDLIELVGNDDGCHALLLEFQQQVQKHPGILLVQRGGGLVQDQQLHVLRQCLGDLHELLLAGADVLDQGGCFVLQAHLAHMLLRLIIGAVPVHAQLALAFVAEEHILADRQLGDQRQFLMDDDDALLLAVLQRLKLADFTVIDDVAGVASVGIDAAENIHQGGFTRAVLTDQSVDLSPLHFDINIVQGLDAREFLCDVFHHKNMICQIG